MGVHQHLVVVHVTDGHVRLAIVPKGRAACHQADAHLRPPRAVPMLSTFTAHIAIIRGGGRADRLPRSTVAAAWSSHAVALSGNCVPVLTHRGITAPPPLERLAVTSG